MAGRTWRVAWRAGVAAVVGLAVLALPRPAFAHASLVSSNPQAGAVVAKAPPRVTVTFDEAVGITADSLRVLAPDGTRADSGNPVPGSGSAQVTVGLLGNLGQGTYTVAWHVISADSHPVQGAFTFSIGTRSATLVNPASLGRPASPLARAVFGVVRWLAFASFVLLMGAVAFLIWCWPEGATRRPVQRLILGAWAGLAVSVLAALLLQGVYGTGQGIGQLFHLDAERAALDSRYGQAIGLRLLLAVVALAGVAIVLDGLVTNWRRRVTAGSAWVALTAALAGTWAIADHASTGIQVAVAIPSDVIHLSAAATWIGGLVILATIVLRRPTGTPRKSGRRTRRQLQEQATIEAAQAVTRFSPIALGCVALLVATGAYQAWRGLGSWSALTATGYGRLLLIKIAGMCALIGLGYLARRHIAAGLQPAATQTAPAPPRPTPPPRIPIGGPARGGGGTRTRTAIRAPAAPATPAEATPAPDLGRMTVSLRRLRWSVTVEAIIATVILAVTAALVNTPTGRQTLIRPVTATVAFDTGGPGGRGTVQLHLTPARSGQNKLDLDIRGSDGAPYQPQETRVDLLLPDRHLGPLAVPLTVGSRGQYHTDQATFSVPGRWQVRITIRSDEIDESTTTVPLTIG